MATVCTCKEKEGGCVCESLGSVFMGVDKRRTVVGRLDQNGLPGTVESVVAGDVIQKCTVPKEKRRSLNGWMSEGKVFIMVYSKK